MTRTHNGLVCKTYLLKHKITLVQPFYRLFSIFKIMTNIISNIYDQLNTISEIGYLDANYGQLNTGHPNFPTAWPCCFIAVESASYSNLAKNKDKTPQNRQSSEVIVVISLANLIDTAANDTPIEQTELSLHILELIHEKLQGLSITNSSGRLIRTSLNRLKREDSVQAYEISYSVILTDA